MEGGFRAVQHTLVSVIAAVDRPEPTQGPDPASESGADEERKRDRCQQAQKLNLGPERSLTSLKAKATTLDAKLSP